MCTDVPPFAPTANDVQKKVNKSADKTEKELDSLAHQTKSKIDEVSDNLSKKVDDFKDDLPQKEAKVKAYFKKAYNSVVGTATSLYTSSVETVKENPVTTSQLFLALVGTAGAVFALSTDPDVFNKWISKRENKALAGGIAATLAVLDGLFISYVKQKKST
ncbi:hypothetical protein KL933_002775 [Ogataea haglerorum]|uniref:Uncharacterized protein n=1 Tax=Ogataea haglerorum TaxID=1937702 RepID=A0AAN6I0K0_9ASCO|nr:uncharacterized protein KL911_000911 [Ogataea haglerorum]KAG7697725.1 hypothetical protein KL951_002299 [Ogataea haglerorum]KAG7701326.1 hypothetical protein KL915_000357 [Ogataea haglerorum]KAG7706545.1 hypothetical protein KL950_003210 [Ogataea haglerorum]KAG7709284.1 hypothetical protein KL914_001674 [Ogataea haglerorum]KAG7727066.1 hypothetical protein KL933_002775 [Ogataea haglerorum]